MNNLSSDFKFIDMLRLQNEKELIRAEFQRGVPFELVVIDNFLTAEGLKLLDVSSLNSIATSPEYSSDFIFAKKKIENPNLSEISDATRILRKELLSPEFEDFLKFITNRDVFLDEKFVGGGLHQGGSGSFLDMHADFSRHPEKREWIRELNLLLYLNHNWKEEHGGALDLFNPVSGQRKSIDPIENRLVIMLTKEHTLHGYKTINFPDGLLRTSVAAYAYCLDNGSESVPYRSTSWFPESKTKRLISMFSNRIVPIKQRIFGSRTAKRANKSQRVVEGN